MANPIVIQSSNAALIVPTWCLVVATIAAVIYQVRETRRSRSAEALARFRDSWDSDTNRTRRRRLALALLDGMTVETIPSSAIEDVINFFEDLATSLRERYLSRYPVYSTFHDDAVHYWTAIGDAYARECRDDEKRSQDYVDFQWMVGELKKIESRKTGRAVRARLADRTRIP
jgi:hypothetical protein